MNINELHKTATSGGRAAEEQLFKNLAEIFRLFAQQRVWSQQDAEEIVQETLMTVARKYKSIVFETSFAAWAYKILEYNILHYYRTQRTRESKHSRLSADDRRLSSTTPDPTLKIKLMECLKKIGAANPRHARILNLKYLGYSTDEICTKLETTRNNVYIILCRARAHLKRCLEKGDVK